MHHFDAEARAFPISKKKLFMLFTVAHYPTLQLGFFFLAFSSISDEVVDSFDYIS
jgi:hypothetical protein